MVLAFEFTGFHLEFQFLSFLKHSIQGQISYQSLDGRTSLKCYPEVEVSGLVDSLAMCISPSSWFFRTCRLFSGAVLSASASFLLEYSVNKRYPAPPCRLASPLLSPCLSYSSVPCTVPEVSVLEVSGLCPVFLPVLDCLSTNLYWSANVSLNLRLL